MSRTYGICCALALVALFPAPAVAQSPVPTLADDPGPGLQSAPLSESAAAPTPPVDLSQQFSAAGAAASTTTRQQAQSNRLAQAPEMFGDSLMLAGLGAETLIFGAGSDFGVAGTQLSFPLGNLGQRVGDQNTPLPLDRVFYRYSYFNNVASMSTSIDSLFTDATFFAQRSLSVHTMGFEKTLFDGWCSISLQMPFAERKNFSEIFEAGDFTVDESLQFGGEGNLFAIGKLMLYEGNETAVATGMSIDMPTGRNANFLIANEIAAVYRNEATFLTPFLATMWTPTSHWFHQAWLGINVPVADNAVDVYTTPGAPAPEATLAVDQLTLLTFDLSSGYWLYRGRDDLQIEGFALIGEFHYTGALEDPTTVVFNEGIFGDELTATPSALGRLDVLNFTPAVHMQVRDSWSIRIGGVFPLADRLFNNEFSVQSILRF